jgi:chromosome segregation ATPase
MDYIVLVVTVLICAVVPFIAYVLGKRAGFNASDEEMANLREESRNLENSLVETLSDHHKFASKGQISGLASKAEEFLKAVSQQRELVDSVTEKLERTRIEVERRENEQQELRAVKEEDEVAIAQVFSAYNEFSTESLNLEQKLAESLKTLDAMSSEIKMTPDQKSVFQELSNALTATSAQLRDVIIDYQNANERLTTLRDRFADLEREYTKLVEKQLAG